MNEYVMERRGLLDGGCSVMLAGGAPPLRISSTLKAVRRFPEMRDNLWYQLILVEVTG